MNLELKFRKIQLSKVKALEALVLLSAIRSQFQWLSIIVAPAVESGPPLREWNQLIAKLEIHTTRAIVNILENNIVKRLDFDLADEKRRLFNLVAEFGPCTSVFEFTDYLSEMPTHNLCSNAKSARLILASIELAEKQIYLLYKVSLSEKTRGRKRDRRTWVSVLQANTSHLRVRIYLDHPQLIDNTSWEKRMTKFVNRLKSDD